jgi:hypothetical protein
MNQALLQSLLNYDPETGIFTYKHTLIKKTRVYHYAGDLVDTIRNGYFCVSIAKTSYYLHRLAYLYMTGSMPNDCVDHIDGNTQNNKWNNLRETTKKLNPKNRAGDCDSLTKVKGVYFNKKLGRYTSQIMSDGKSHYLGAYDTVDEAKAAYDAKAKELHGEYFRS